MSLEQFSSYPEQQEPDSDGLFFDSYKQQLEELFKVLDIRDLWSEDLGQIFKATQPWSKGDHARPVHKYEFSEDQILHAKQLFRSMGMVEEKTLPSGEYDDVVVLGAMHRGNIRRLEVLAESIAREDITIKRISLLGGQRHPYMESEADEIANNIEQLENRADTPKWVEKLDRQQLGSIWETDMIRMAAYLNLGSFTLKRLHLELGDTDPIRSYDFLLDETPLMLLHTRAVARSQGEPRHTTEACIKDWAGYIRPTPKAVARVGFIGANPHLDRMLRSANKALAEIGRSDIQLVPAGSAAIENLGLSIFLGEIARNLYEDYQLVNQ